MREWKHFKRFDAFDEFKNGELLVDLLEHAWGLPALLMTISNLEEAESLMLRNDLLTVQSSLPIFVVVVSFDTHHSFCFYYYRFSILLPLPLDCTRILAGTIRDLSLGALVSRAQPMDLGHQAPSSSHKGGCPLLGIPISYICLSLVLFP